MTDSFVRLTADLKGILQGVGFRPTMAKRVAEARLTGWVRNQAGTVRLVLEGPKSVVDDFAENVAEKLPVQARLESVTVLSRDLILPEDASRCFEILESAAGDEMRISIPADLAMCSDCRGEVLDPESRYFRYPFTTCTNCGPRYTVVDGMPYDREKTALKVFPLCEECRREYTDPLDRRFHAESIACPNCGPSVFVADQGGKTIECDDPIKKARELLASGGIVAVRGLGGYLLTADASAKAPLMRLRQRKHRPAKPFAIMARNLSVLEGQCRVGPVEKALLTSAASPIVVLDLEPTCTLPTELLAPGTGTLGVMLPTTPLHMLLAEPAAPGEAPFDFLLMTSGNRGGEPICIDNEEAFERLSGIADLFLCHDRGINLRNDDSLCAVVDEEPQLWRRARGYAPESLRMRRTLERVTLAMGAELKNTVGLGFGDEAVLSPHIGDLETPEALDGLESVVERFPRYFQKRPERVVVDLHPDMRSTRMGRKLAEKLGAEVVAVQHHHAHAASVMCEHGLEEALALVFDGTGLGTDGSIWGSELLHVTPEGFSRLGTIAAAPLLGGDAAVREPVRQLAGRFFALGLELNGPWLERLGVTEEEAHIWRLQHDKKLGIHMSHGAGRLFDAVSVALGVSPPAITYEGQAAITLEGAARRADRAAPLDCGYKAREENGMLCLDFGPLFAWIHATCPPRDESAGLALGFHALLVEAALEMVRYGSQKADALPIVLSGGVMMNRVFAQGVAKALRNEGFPVFSHRQVPPNDGGIALGQIFAV